MESTSATRQKRFGAYYTPDEVVHSLVRWATRRPDDRLLDPACGDGRFLAAHHNSVGVEFDPGAAAVARVRAPESLVHESDFFAWASDTAERFDCVVGNPPFIRYHRFSGQTRAQALRLCEAHGATFNALSSSWAPFIVAASTRLHGGGRMAFVVPAEIGHAPYAQPVLRHLANRFDVVQVIAVRDRLFPDLSEDCWLLYCDGFGGRTDALAFSVVDRFTCAPRPPSATLRISLAEWHRWDCRLRPFLLPAETRDLYLEAALSPDSCRLLDVASVGIGYVTGANDFFHLRPSDARKSGIPERLLHPSVRNGRCLTGRAVTPSTVEKWRRNDEPMFLLRLSADDAIPRTVQAYLDSAAGHKAREAYKCRNRNPWYVVPDVRVPCAFLSYMSGLTPSLVANRATCVASNSVHVVRLRGNMPLSRLMERWHQPLTQLSCELEGHPLGGGMLKLEPREAGRVLLTPRRQQNGSCQSLIEDGINVLRAWRHYG